MDSASPKLDLWCFPLPNEFFMVMSCEQCQLHRSTELPGFGCQYRACKCFGRDQLSSRSCFSSGPRGAWKKSKNPWWNPKTRGAAAAAPPTGRVKSVYWHLLRLSAASEEMDADLQWQNPAVRMASASGRPTDRDFYMLEVGSGWMSTGHQWRKILKRYSENDRNPSRNYPSWIVPGNGILRPFSSMIKTHWNFDSTGQTFIASGHENPSLQRVNKTNRVAWIKHKSIINIIYRMLFVYIYIYNYIY